jgi:hypothetical protein
MIAAVTGGMQMTQSDILLLARTLAAARGVKLSTVSRWATRDTNPMLFGRLAAGRGCSTHTVELVGEWFERFWPRNVEWPPSVPRHRSP